MGRPARFIKTNALVLQPMHGTGTRISACQKTTVPKNIKNADMGKYFSKDVPLMTFGMAVALLNSTIMLLASINITKITARLCSGTKVFIIG